MKKSLISLALIAMASAGVGVSTSKTMTNANTLKTNTSGNYRYYDSDYSSKEEALEAGLKVNEEICEEGMVLVKNNNNALPLATSTGTSASRVTLFGYRSISPQGGASSSGDTSAGKVKLTCDIYSSLKDAGYVVNPTVKSAYESLVAAGNNDDVKLYDAMFGASSTVKDDVERSYGLYDDAAIVVLSAGTSAYTGKDAKRTHKLQLDDEQIKLVKEAEANFDKVIVLINDSTPLELGVLENDDKVDAILIVGQPGDNGFEAVGKILNGEVNPSGHLADTYAADFTKDPSYNNINTTGNANEGNPRYYVDKDGDGVADDDEKTDTYYCDYDEGIYVGYRYWETADAEAKAGNYTGFDYDTAVTYPFGYGLSYTNFEWTLVGNPSITEIDGDETLEYKVNVKNVGDVAGKDVVELYYHTPYTTYDKTNKVEKAEVVLGDYAKTGLIQPGQSQTVTLSIDVKDMASYDYTLAKTYILDAGTYEVSFRTDSHTVKDATMTKSYTVNGTNPIKIDTAVTGKTITNAFDDVTTEASEKHGVGTFSRSNFADTFPQAETATEGVITQAEYDEFAYDVSDKETDPWYTTEMPNYMTAEDRANKPVADVKLSDLVGKDYDDPLWDDLLDELTLDEMQNLISNGGFRTETIDYIGKPYSLDTDGPKGWTGTGTAGNTKFNAFAAEPVIAATFSKELAYKMGEVVGDQGIWGCSDRTDTAAGGRVYGYTGWYAPGMNIHRSPFEGRITEYFSEDPLLTGMITANQSLGIKSKGGFVFIKHFAVHEDGGGVGISISASGGYSIGGYRGTSDAHSGTAYWLTEQALREVYLKPFQIAVEDGEAGACMSSFSRIGKTWAGGDYSLLTTLLRDEWGFKGYVVTDIDIYGFLNCDQMIRAGGDCILTSSINSTSKDCGQSKWSSDGSNSMTNPSATQVAAMRRACKAILYTVANSHAMDIPMGAKVLDPSETQDEFNVPNGKVGEAYSADFSTKLNTKFAYSTISYSVDGTLPDGLTLDATTGKLTGTPTTTGTYTFNVVASADGYESSTTTVTLTIASATGDTTGGKTVADLEKEIADLKSKLSTDETTNKTLQDKITALETEVNNLKNNTSTKSGCGGSVIAATSAVAAIGLLGLGLALKKKKEN